MRIKLSYLVKVCMSVAFINVTVGLHFEKEGSKARYKSDHLWLFQGL